MKKEAVGIICEFNPFHKGHLYFINEVKSKYPNHIIILVLNGYFLERGEASILSKKSKTEISLEYGVDLVIEHPFIFGTQSADTFAESAVTMLNHLNITTLVFGSESNDINIIKEIANKQINNNDFNEKVKENLSLGLNYPTSLAKALEIENFDFTPNDILGICYTKAIIKNNYNIEIDTIKRTNSFHDNLSNDEIVSASNIREKIKNKISIDNNIPNNVIDKINVIDEKLLFNILKNKILTDSNLDNYLDVDEGINNRLVKYIKEVNNLEDFIKLIKTKRYTYNKLNRMFIHILHGITKEKFLLEYIKILGFNIDGKNYLNQVKKDTTISLVPLKESIQYIHELNASIMYNMLTNEDTYTFENSNKPIFKEEI